MACDSLLTTSLLQVVNRLVQTDCAYLLPTGLLQVVSTSCNKSANDNLQQQTWKFKEIDSFVAILLLLYSRKCAISNVGQRILINPAFFYMIQQGSGRY